MNMSISMIWHRSSGLRSSLMGLLQPRAAGQAAEPRDLEDLRSAFLESLGYDGRLNYPMLVRRLRFAQDPEALWYLRSEVMDALAAVHGEARARALMGDLSALFDGQIPTTMKPRESRVGPRRKR